MISPHLRAHLSIIPRLNRFLNSKAIFVLLAHGHCCSHTAKIKQKHHHCVFETNAAGQLFFLNNALLVKLKMVVGMRLFRGLLELPYLCYVRTRKVFVPFSRGEVELNMKLVSTSTIYFAVGCFGSEKLRWRQFKAK